MSLSSKPTLAALSLAFVLPALAACDAGSDAATEGKPVTSSEGRAEETLSAALADADGLGTLNRAVAASGIGAVFDGPGSYTVLAPSDAAFTALGSDGEALLTPEQKPVLAGLLREHVLPGHLTPDNIAQAIADKGGPVTMTTLGGGAVTFSKDGDIITAANEGGVKAPFAGAVRSASNGVVIPIGAVLLPPKES